MSGSSIKSESCGIVSVAAATWTFPLDRGRPWFRKFLLLWSDRLWMTRCGWHLAITGVSWCRLLPHISMNDVWTLRCGKLRCGCGAGRSFLACAFYRSGRPLYVLGLFEEFRLALVLSVWFNSDCKGPRPSSILCSEPLSKTWLK